MESVKRNFKIDYISSSRSLEEGLISDQSSLNPIILIYTQLSID